MSRQDVAAEAFKRYGAHTATVFTHRRPADTTDVLGLLIEAARDANVTLRFDAEETSKHGLEAGPNVAVDAEISREVDLCIVLGGDGSILRALREYVGTGVPVFAVNFGEIGFLATLDPGQMRPDFAGAFDLRFEVLELPVLKLAGADGLSHAINDVAVHRRAGMRVAELAYEIAGQRGGQRPLRRPRRLHPRGIDRLQPRQRRADHGVGGRGLRDLVRRAPLAGRPFARDRARRDARRSQPVAEEPVDVAVDGRPAGEIPPEGAIEVRLERGQSNLAQLEGVSFYGRLHEKFDRLSR